MEQMPGNDTPAPELPSHEEESVGVEVQVPVEAEPELPTTSRERVTAETQDQAKLMRMETWLENAACLDKVTDFIEHNPEATAAELEATIRENGGSVNPEMLDRFLTMVLASHEQVENSLSALGELATANSHTTGEELYQWLTGNNIGNLQQGVYPTGSVELRRYPLCLGLVINDFQDMEVLKEEPEEIGGFYKPSVVWAPEKFKLMSEICNPALVVIRGDEPMQEYKPSVEKHEIAHAEHRVFRNALDARRPHKAHIWGDYNLLQMYSLAKVGREEEKLENDERLNTPGVGESVAGQAALDYTCSMAKDEILAGIHQGRNPDEWVERLCKREGNYDFFRGGVLALPTESVAYQELWEKHEAIVRTSMSTAAEIMETYKAAGLHDRANQFRWVLAQIPLADWPEQLERTLFTEEIELLKEVELTEETVAAMQERQEGLLLPWLREHATAQEPPEQSEEASPE